MTWGAKDQRPGPQGSQSRYTLHAHHLTRLMIPVPCAIVQQRHRIN